MKLVESANAAPIESSEDSGISSLTPNWARPPLGMKFLSSKYRKIKLRPGDLRREIRGRLEIRLHSKVEENPVSPCELLLAKRSHFMNIFEAGVRCLIGYSLSVK